MVCDNDVTYDKYEEDCASDGYRYCKRYQELANQTKKPREWKRMVNKKQTDVPGSDWWWPWRRWRL